MDPFLIISSEGRRRLSLAGKSCWTFGRAADNDIVVESEWISRHHAMFQRTDSGLIYFIDLGSHNGSLLNGQRVVAPAMLTDGDKLVLGREIVEFRSPSSVGSPAGADELGAAGHQARSVTMALRDKLLVSVLVVDIRDFTVLARTLPEQTLSKMVAAFHTRAGLILRAQGSWGAKSTGDGQTAVWTHDDVLPLPNSDVQPPLASENPDKSDSLVLDPQLVRLFGAALGIADLAVALGREFDVPHPLRIGVGVNTGFAMVGYIGAGDRPEYAAVGETVNAAFRLESSTKQTGLQMMIGEKTYDRLFRGSAPQSLIAPSMPTRPPFTSHSLRIKGYDADVRAYGCSFAELRALLEDAQRNG